MQTQLIAFDQLKKFYFIIENEPDETQLMMLSAESAGLSLYVHHETEFQEVTILFNPSLLKEWLAAFQEIVRLRCLSSNLLNLTILDEAQ
ncbi:hypothetical protein J9317_07100 [Metabacillus sp. KIGAM252]|uniref:DUF4911 domain-containing protein n=1 Tax=Metabacillus flavus TaxID=2823519 RepID=A0ABS5LDA6_9BACI|nr:hypothetical protein [Metabacillus flavus]MBS2968523.1 hypothetical protein [Metabacillus flavus]